MVISVNFKSWQKGFDSFNKETKKQQKKFLKVLGRDFKKRVKKNTPIGDPGTWVKAAPPGYVPGDLKRSWRMTKTAEAVVIFNTAPYAERIENGWYRTIPPHGMLRRTIKELDSIISKAIKKSFK